MSKSSGLSLTRWLYLRMVGAIHLSAFWSYAVMILGLNGSHGVVPTHALLESTADLGPLRYFYLPTLEWLNCSDAFIQTIAWSGTAASLLVLLGICTGPALLACLFLWLSLVVGGGEFTGFQSDGMLVEATFLSLFIVPWSLFEPPWPVPARLKEQRTPSLIGIWLLRFMIFRLMFASGLVKLLSGDTTWLNLTALQYHFETQPIPTPLAWYANQLPHWFLKVNVAIMFFIELVLPWLVFGPAPARLIAAAGFAALHLGIIITGNYTFLNYLTIALAFTLLDDSLLKPIFPSRLRTAIETAIVEKQPSRIKLTLVRSCAAILLALAGLQLLGTAVRPLPDPLTAALILVSPFHICDRYGLFAVMTTTRPEIVFEGSNDGLVWKPYEFKYKVGDDLKRAPPWVAPHMPRLDWRLWFAAMEPAGANTWVLSLVNRMLEGSPLMLDFFSSNPFRDKPPKYIRAFVYDYHFTNYAQRRKTGDWWWRDNKQIYLPLMTLTNGQLELRNSDSLSAP